MRVERLFQVPGCKVKADLWHRIKKVCKEGYEPADLLQYGLQRAEDQIQQGKAHDREEATNGNH